MFSNRAYAVRDADAPDEIAPPTGGAERAARPPDADPDRAGERAPSMGCWSELTLSAYDRLRRPAMDIDTDKGKGRLGAATLIAICIGSVVGWVLGLLALWGFFNVI